MMTFNRLWFTSSMLIHYLLDKCKFCQTISHLPFRGYIQHIISVLYVFSVHVLHFPYLTFGWPALMGLHPFWQPGCFFPNKYCCCCLNEAEYMTTCLYIMAARCPAKNCKLYASKRKRCHAVKHEMQPFAYLCTYSTYLLILNFNWKSTLSQRCKQCNKLSRVCNSHVYAK